MSEKKGMDPKLAAALGVAAGLAVGAAAGAMTDPKKREQVKKVAGRVGKAAEKAVKNLRHQAAELTSEVKQKIHEASK